MKNLMLTCLLLVSSSCCLAEVTVIVHPSNANNLDATAISYLFLGKSKAFPDGTQAIPVMQTGGSTTDEFNDKVINKSASQLKAYWSKLLFTGQGTPPREVNSDADVMKLVADNPNIIGYVSSASLNDSVKAIASF